MRAPADIRALVQVGPVDWLAFSDPLCVLSSDTVDGIAPLIADVEGLTRDQRLHAVGFLTYEAGAAFGLSVLDRPSGLPFAWFALFESHRVTPCGPPVATVSYEVGTLAPSLSRSEFQAAFDQVRARIAAGDTYQANLTFRVSAAFSGDARSFFASLVGAQRGMHSVFLDLGEQAICCASPELFFQIRGTEIHTRPMKGTAPRGKTLAQDVAERDRLQESPKQRAENVMIVDMMRNDLGRIAEVGSVSVPDLFVVERYPTLWQMTSHVKARSMAPLAEIVRALHPSASVTGAPKIRTMEILSALESGPRGVYTGAIGHVPPDGNASFSVAIRTAVVDRHAGQVTFGIGSGIVWDSVASEEYDECLLKARVLSAPPLSFDLLETLRWAPESGYFLLDRHLQRLGDSAEFFGYAFDRTAIDHALGQAVEGGSLPQRVRLLLPRDGTARIECHPFGAVAGDVRVALAATPVDASDVRLFHKTTDRAVYDQARRSIPGVEDVILWNEAGEVTESTIANVVVELEGRRVTPPVACGLLAGTFRADLLERGEIEERIVTLDDLKAASCVWLINSVRGWQRATLTSEF